jgi:hypothetical protein
MGRRGQITIFIIIGIIAVILISTIFYFIVNNGTSTIINENEQDDLSPIKKHITSCLSDELTKTIVLLGKQGAINPNTYLAAKDVKISYYYFKGEKFLPSINDIKQEIEKKLKTTTRNCLDDFKSNKFLIEPTYEIDTNIEFTNNSINANLIFPINIYYEGQTIKLSEFNTKLNIDFNQIYELIKKIILDTYNDPEWINFENLYDDSYDVKLIKVDDQTILYVISDKNMIINEENFEYRFAVKYDI